jgi:hypothetical protein
VYAAVLDAIFTGTSPDTLLVAESTFVFRSAGNRAANRRVPFDTVPFALRTRLAEISQTRSSSRTLALPLPVRTITAAELSAIFRGGPGGDGWEEFYRRYPQYRAWYAFTPMAFNDDRSQAYVYYERYCGGLCGVGEGFWVVRSREDGMWRVRLRAMYWVS